MSNKKGGVAPLLAAAGGAVLLGMTYLATRKKKSETSVEVPTVEGGGKKKKKTAHVDVATSGEQKPKEEKLVIAQEPEVRVPLDFLRPPFLDDSGWLAGDADESPTAEDQGTKVRAVIAAVSSAEDVVKTALDQMDELGARAPHAVETIIQRLTLRYVLGCDVATETKILAIFVDFFGSGLDSEKKELLSSFAAFLVGDALLRRGKNKELAMQLLGFCAAGSDSNCSADNDTLADGRFSALPRKPIPFFLPHALLDIASLMEEGFSNGLPEAYSEIHSRGMSLKPIIRAIQLTRGDNQKAWQALGTSVDRRGVEVLGRLVTPANAFAEAIRCAGGIDGCNDAQMWLELALCMQYDLRLPEQVSSATIPRNGFRSFTGTKPLEGDKVDKKFCLVRCLTIEMEEAAAWLELSSCLAVGNSVEQEVDPTTGQKIFRQQQREEKVNVGAMGFSRMDCLSLALALEPDNAEAWYRSALCMEDRVKCEAAVKRGVVADRNIFERQILQGTRPFDRVTCLMRAVQCDAGEGKYWFALGTTLAEREELLEDGVAAGTADVTHTLPASVFAMAIGAESLTDLVSPVVLTGEKCFAAAKAVNPQFGRVVDQWRQGRIKPPGALAVEGA